MNRLRYSIITKLIYLFPCAVFFILMAIDNPQLIRISRTSIIVFAIYWLSVFVGGYIFGHLDVGKRKLRDITNSLLLIQLFTDFAAYMSLMLMNTNIYSDNIFRLSAKKYLLICVILHILAILLLSKHLNALYFKIHAGEKCCVILDDIKANIRNIREAMDSKNIVVKELIDVNDIEKWKKEIAEVDTIVLQGLSLGQREYVMEYAYKYNKNIYFEPHICDILEVSAEHQMFDDSLMLYSPKIELTVWQRIAKRTMDVVISLLMIIVSCPIWLICALIIKIDDGGDIFFKQERVTQDGRIFKIIKFRTMRASDDTNPMKAGDSRVTKAGNIIRKTRMDELPQLVNILKGDMSLVGPRPEQLKYIHGFDQDYEEYEYRLKVKAGLTGYAQIEGKYNTTNKDKLILDLMYIQNYSIWLDIKLIMQTVLVFFKKESSEGFEKI